MSPFYVMAAQALKMERAPFSGAAQLEGSIQGR
jgi:hypothetical protein